MNIIVLAFIGAVIVTAILVGARVLLGKKPTDMRQVAAYGALFFVLNFIGDLLLLYFAMPALTGPYGGWQWVLWPLILSGGLSILLSGVAAGSRFAEQLTQGSLWRQLRGRVVVPARTPSWRTWVGEGGGSAGIIAIAVALTVALIVNSLIVIFTTWFDPNAKALSAIPNIAVQTSNAGLPTTDVKHIVLVTQGIAAFKGQQVLSQSGQNLGSKFHVEQTQFVLQSIAQHLYWIAPLVYNNVFSNIGNYDTPGFVAVDAEDPDAQPKLYTDHHLHYVPAALLNQELLRHVYLSGYTYGDLLDPTLEVDDNWKPYFTISVMQPSRGFTGEQLYRVLLVDAETGAIQDFAPKDVPSWVDRVMPASVVNDYLTWWGLYHSAPWFNLSGAGQQKPAQMPQLVYNSVDQPVWLIPMTSNTQTDSASTGFILFDTRDNGAKFYPLTGVGVGDNVNSVFTAAEAPRTFNVSAVQLYVIYGVPTWVAIYTQPNQFGETFQMIGMVPANDLNGSSVQLGTTRDLALSAYSQWLASKNQLTVGDPNAGVGKKTVTGKVIRIAPVQVNNATLYYLSLVGQSHIFTAPLSLSPLLPLVQPGDTVTISYVDSSQQLVNLLAFDDPSISSQLGTPGATP